MVRAVVASPVSKVAVIGFRLVLTPTKLTRLKTPVINWTSFVLTSDGTNFFTRYWFDAPPWEKPEEYLRRSPLQYVGNVKTPTMLLTGEQDFRTPISEAEQFFTALKLRKVDTALVRFPGASHDLITRPSQLIAKVSYILAWFEKHRPEPAAR